MKKFGVIKSEEEADKLFQKDQLFGTLQFQADLKSAGASCEDLQIRNERRAGKDLPQNNLIPIFTDSKSAKHKDIYC